VAPTFIIIFNSFTSPNLTSGGEGGMLIDYNAQHYYASRRGQIYDDGSIAVLVFNVYYFILCTKDLTIIITII